MPPIEPPPSFWEMAALHLSEAKPLIPMYIHLILSAVFPIYTGAHASLSRPSSAAKPDKKARKKADPEDDSDDEDKIQKMEGMSNKDAIVLPITAGLVLMGLYFLIKWYGADLINLILGWYFAGVGMFSVAKLVNDAAVFVVGFCFPTWYGDQGKLWRVAQNEQRAMSNNGAMDRRSSPLPGVLGRLPLPKIASDLYWQVRGATKQKVSIKAYIATLLHVRANVTLINILSAVFGLATIIYVNTVSKPWFLTNLQGFAVSYSALQLMSPTTFSTGSLILAALFCYDIWAVFFTPFMVGVAKNLDQPIKLVFPRPDEPSATPGEPPVKSYSMLGLGDIVLPGIMIGLALRFDLYMFYLRKQKKLTREEGKDEVEKAPYVSVTGKWGERFWTMGLPTSSLPPQLKFAFPKTYFTASLVGYIFGMLTTLGVMSVFQHAQPALLYLVPGVLLSIWATAIARGELKDLWQFSEAATAEHIEEEGKAGEMKDGEQEQQPKGLFERLWHEIWAGDDKKEDLKTKELSKERKESTTISRSKQDDSHSADESIDFDEASVLFSFSVERFDPSRSRKVKSKAERPRPRSSARKPQSSSSSEASDDAVVVTSTDLKDSPGEEPRYRTRSARGQPEQKRVRTD